jgi:hypothetical protein
MGEGEVARMKHLTGKKQWDVVHGAGLDAAQRAYPQEPEGRWHTEVQMAAENMYTVLSASVS